LKEVKKLTPMELMELQFKALKEQEEKIAQVENKVDKLEEDMPLFQIDCKEIQALVRKKGIEALGGYRSIAYNDNSLRGKVYSDIQQQIRREFGVLRYEAIKRSQLEMAKENLDYYNNELELNKNSDANPDYIASLEESIEYSKEQIKNYEDIIKNGVNEDEWKKQLDEEIEYAKEDIARYEKYDDEWSKQYILEVQERLEK
ncbi:ORF6C domain-containing protein, partial [Clostridium saudiense]|nr:ORF6C domain-containing protein [Clostridium saudiense]